MRATRDVHERLQTLTAVPGISDVVWAALARVRTGRDPVRLAFVSAEPRAGTSSLAAATAIGLLDHLRVPVCLVETNVERPALAGYLGLHGAGLSDILDGRAGLEDCLQEPHDCPGLYVLPAGTARLLAPGEFTTDRMKALLEEIGERGRYLVLDVPPLLGRLESRLLLKDVDGALLVLRARATRRLDAERAHRILVEAGAPVLGTIFNAYRPDMPLARGEGREDARENERRLDARRAASVGAPDVAAREPIAVVEPLTEPAAALADVDLRDFAQGWPAAAPVSNGVAHEQQPPEPGFVSAEAHQREVEILERRIAKLTEMLAQTEEDLRRIATAKIGDPGIASIYRRVQGLSAETEALAFKKQLMQKIFQANLELQNAIARAP